MISQRKPTVVVDHIPGKKPPLSNAVPTRATNVASPGSASRAREVTGMVTASCPLTVVIEETLNGSDRTRACHHRWSLQQKRGPDCSGPLVVPLFRLLRLRDQHRRVVGARVEHAVVGIAAGAEVAE